MRKFSGKVAVITGGGTGIGAAISEALANEGAAVAFNYKKSKNASEELARKIVQSGGQALALKADVGKQSEVKEFFQTIDQRFGRVDMLINNAGVSAISNGADGSLLSITEEQFDAAFAVNVKGVLFCTQEAVRRLPPGGRVINIVSSSGDFPSPNLTLYTASKFTPRAFTSVWAKELGPRGITVNGVAPGPISAGMTGEAPPALFEYLKTTNPFGRMGTAEEVASLVTFLCSDGASWISGQTILINGAGTT